MMANLENDIIEQIPHLRRYARALTQHRERADDLVQDCLERAIANQQRFVVGTQLRAWLFTIMHNVFVNTLRRQYNTPYSVALDNPDAAPLASSENATGAESLLMVRDLDLALRRLPIEQREVVLLVGLEGLSYQDVSQVLDVPIGTVMSRLHRGREALRKAVYGQVQPLGETV